MDLELGSACPRCLPQNRWDTVRAVRRGTDDACAQPSQAEGTARASAQGRGRREAGDPEALETATLEADTLSRRLRGGGKGLPPPARREGGPRAGAPQRLPST